MSLAALTAVVNILGNYQFNQTRKQEACITQELWSVELCFSFKLNTASAVWIRIFKNIGGGKGGGRLSTSTQVWHDMT